ncbi:hypothetical protein F2Q69_00050392 [Brassica cretica]|uniref:Uncharacterized protein n=1 Tax=Brassica cretica TaxID=69181 RepID=A0A8S9PYT3_BRACR|nr:hypothetical protein F2Q69_00050392 [Brassica cretica]
MWDVNSPSRDVGGKQYIGNIPSPISRTYYINMGHLYRLHSGGLPHHIYIAQGTNTHMMWDVNIMRDQLCRHETRVIMHFLEMNGKFPTFYVETLCNVFGGDEKKVKVYRLRY